MRSCVRRTCTLALNSCSLSFSVTRSSARASPTTGERSTVALTPPPSMACCSTTWRRKPGVIALAMLCPVLPARSCVACSPDSEIALSEFIVRTIVSAAARYVWRRGGSSSRRPRRLLGSAGFGERFQALELLAEDAVDCRCELLEPGTGRAADAIGHTQDGLGLLRRDGEGEHAVDRQLLQRAQVGVHAQRSARLHLDHA